MKSGYILILAITMGITFPTLLTGQTDTIYQNLPLKQEFTKDSMLVIFKVVDKNTSKIPNVELRLKDNALNKLYIAKADANAIARFKVPPGKKYIIGIENIDNYRELFVKYEPGIVFAKKLEYRPYKVDEKELNDTITQNLPHNVKPTSDRAKVIIKLYNFESSYLSNEDVYIKSLKTNKIYKSKTDGYGQSEFLLPMGCNYQLNLKHEENIDIIDLSKFLNFYTHTLKYTYMGSDEILKRRLERARLARERDSIYEYRLKYDTVFALSSFMNHIFRGASVETVKEKIKERAKREEEEVQKDKLFYQKSNQEISAVFYRMKEKWTNNIVVTDITGSMNPYMDQVLIWHLLKFNKSSKTKYYFFNDGDDKNTPDKVIGNTGGIYNITPDSIDQLLSKMVEAQRNGSGGDSPENDTEALLEATKKSSSNGHVILIADNYSDVRDLRLLYKLKIAVHVIVCGSRQGIHEHYLEIAYRTNGTVHTLNEDINDLKKAREGTIITVFNNRYRFSRGKFYLLRK